MKKCKTCTQIKPYTEFWTDNKAKDKHRTSCIVCDKSRKKRWRKQNTEHIRRYNNQWREDNPNKRRSEWMKARARSYGIFEQDWDQIDEVYEYWKSQEIDSTKCYFCQEELPPNFHIDHAVPYNRGGTNDKSNLFPCCPSCNTAKKNMTVEEYINRR